MKEGMNTPIPNVPILSVEIVECTSKLLTLDIANLDGIRKPFEGVFVIKIDAATATELAKFQTEFDNNVMVLLKRIYTDVAQPIYKTATLCVALGDIVTGGRFLLTFDTDERKLYLVR
ncbi:MAG: hypothetical protein K6G25_06585 [Bacteroidales bacterium]|nr:hypothetical protein [Bacteroidales bacterium]